MPFPYDATTKFFMSLNLKDWLVLIGAPIPFEVTELNSDLSTVSGNADKLFRVNGPDPWIEHVEVQSGHDIDVPIRLCRYGVLALYEYRLPVNSTVVLLRPQANGPELTGTFEGVRNGVRYLQYRYNVVPVWEIPAQFFLDAGIGVLALAPLGKIEDAELPNLMRWTRERVEKELPTSQWTEFWTGMGILMGLKFNLTTIQELLKGVDYMRESVVVQAFINEGLEKGLEQGIEQGLEQGSIQEAQKCIIRTIKRRFGSVDPKLQRAVESMKKLAALEELHDLAIDIPHPDDLLPFTSQSTHLT